MREFIVSIVMNMNLSATIAIHLFFCVHKEQVTSEYRCSAISFLEMHLEMVWVDLWQLL